MKGRVHLGMVIGLTLLLTACGSVAENIAERAIEAESGGEVDIDFDNDQATVEFSDGNDEGSGSLVIGGNALPDGFPIPVPDGYEISSTSSFSDDDGTRYSAVLIWDRGDFDRVIDFYEDYFSGMADINRSEFSSDGSTTRGWSTAGLLTSVTVTQDDREVVAIIQAQE